MFDVIHECNSIVEHAVERNVVCHKISSFSQKLLGARRTVSHTGLAVQKSTKYGEHSTQTSAKKYDLVPHLKITVQAFESHVDTKV